MFRKYIGSVLGINMCEEGEESRTGKREAAGSVRSLELENPLGFFLKGSGLGLYRPPLPHYSVAGPGCSVWPRALIKKNSAESYQLPIFQAAGKMSFEGVIWAACHASNWLTLFSGTVFLCATKDGHKQLGLHDLMPATFLSSYSESLSEDFVSLI